MKQIRMVCLMMFMLAVLTACGVKANTNPTEETDNVPEQVSSADSEIHEPQLEEQESTSLLEENISEQETGGKTLIAYFSLVNIVPEGADAVTHATPSVGNTEFAAMEIQKQTGGDLFAIQTVQTYPVNHKEASAIAEEEMREDARPELSTHVENMDGYDVVYIGFPIWLAYHNLIQCTQA